MQIKLNGKMQQFETSLTIASLAQKLALQENRVAIERNGEIVPRSRWGDTALADGDALEIVQFIGGG